MVFFFHIFMDLLSLHGWCGQHQASCLNFPRTLFPIPNLSLVNLEAQVNLKCLQFHVNEQWNLWPGQGQLVTSRRQPSVQATTLLRLSSMYNASPTFSKTNQRSMGDVVSITLATFISHDLFLAFTLGWVHLETRVKFSHLPPQGNKSMTTELAAMRASYCATMAPG